MADKKTNNIKKFIPWIIFGVLVLAFDAMKVMPMTQDWLNLRESTQKSKTTIQLEKIELNKLDKELENIETRFEYEAKNYVLEESQIYPETFDSYKISKILELFSIQHSLLSADSLLRIERISLGGKKKKSEDAQNQKTQIKLEILCSDKTLRRLIAFIQSGELPEELLNNVGNEKFGVSEMEYLLKNKLPIAHIDSIRVNDKKEDTSNIKVTSLDITFFTQN